MEKIHLLPPGFFLFLLQHSVIAGNRFKLRSVWELTLRQSTQPLKKLFNVLRLYDAQLMGIETYRDLKEF